MSKLVGKHWKEITRDLKYFDERLKEIGLTFFIANKDSESIGDWDLFINGPNGFHFSATNINPVKTRDLFWFIIRFHETDYIEK